MPTFTPRRLLRTITQGVCLLAAALLGLSRPAAPAVGAPPHQLYLPAVMTAPAHSITGKVMDFMGAPLPGITIHLSNGLSTVSDSQGNYQFTNLAPGTYTYSASGSGLSFSPSLRTANLPPSLSAKNFTSIATSPVNLNMAGNFHSQIYETNLANACGPASLLTVLDYFGVAAGSLDNVIDVTSGPAPENGGFDSTCTANPVCLSAGVLASIAQNPYQLSANAHENWTFDQLYQSLVRGQPVIALVKWLYGSNGAGHFVVVYAADPVTRIVTYNDPYFGPGRQSTWDSFYANWLGPVDINDPLQPSGHTAWGVGLTK